MAWNLLRVEPLQCLDQCWCLVSSVTHTACAVTASGIVEEIENPSWASVWNGVHLSEFVFQKSQAMASDFYRIQTHDGELSSARMPMIDSISSTMCNFSVITSQKHRKHSQIVGNHGQRHEMSEEEIEMNHQGLWSSKIVMGASCHLMNASSSYWFSFHFRRVQILFLPWYKDIKALTSAISKFEKKLHEYSCINKFLYFEPVRLQPLQHRRPSH